jgi:hypothetical protein
VLGASTAGALLAAVASMMRFAPAESSDLLHPANETISTAHAMTPGEATAATALVRMLCAIVSSIAPIRLNPVVSA